MYYLNVKPSLYTELVDTGNSLYVALFCSNFIFCLGNIVQYYLLKTIYFKILYELFLDRRNYYTVIVYEVQVTSR